MAKVNVVMILDKSGSMESVQGATIEGFNSYISKLKENNENEYRMTLALFDTSVSRKFTNASLDGMLKLDSDNYRPNGGTALYDAVCETLKDLNHEGTDKTVVVIITDGEENASKKYTQENFRDYVKLLTNTDRFTFVYLGANQDAWANAQKFGFSKDNVSAYHSTPRGVNTVFDVSAGATANFADMSANNTTAFFSKSDQDSLNSIK